MNVLSLADDRAALLDLIRATASGGSDAGGGRP